MQIIEYWISEHLDNFSESKKYTENCDCEGVQQVKAMAAQMDNLSSIPGICTLGGKSRYSQVFSWLHLCTPTCAHT